MGVRVTISMHNTQRKHTPDVNEMVKARRNESGSRGRGYRFMAQKAFNIFVSLHPLSSFWTGDGPKFSQQPSRPTYEHSSIYLLGYVCSSANLRLDDCQKEVSGSGKQDTQGRGDL